MHFFSKFFKKTVKKQEEPQQQREASEKPPEWTVRGHLRCQGWCRFFIRGPEQYRRTAIDAALASTQVFCHLDSETFRTRMTSEDVPEAIITEYLSTVTLDDQCYLHPGERGYVKGESYPRKLYLCGRGKCYFYAHGSVQYWPSATEAFSHSIQVLCRINYERFRSLMQGVPEPIVAEYLNSHITVENELRLISNFW